MLRERQPMFKKICLRMAHPDFHCSPRILCKMVPGQCGNSNAIKPLDEPPLGLQTTSEHQELEGLMIRTDSVCKPPKPWSRKSCDDWTAKNTEASKGHNCINHLVKIRQWADKSQWSYAIKHYSNVAALYNNGEVCRNVKHWPGPDGSRQSL